MANAIYPKYKEAVIQSSSNSSLTGTVKVTLVDLADYTYSSAHDFYDDVTVAGRVATATLSSGKTYTNGVFDADDITFTTVTGDQCEALIIWIDTGVEATSRLVAFLDTGITGMPVTPSGGNITVTWDSGANKIFAL